MDSFKSGSQPLRSEYFLSACLGECRSNASAEKRMMKRNSEGFPATNREVSYSIGNKERSDWCWWRQTHLQHLAAAHLLIQCTKEAAVVLFPVGSPSEHEAAFHFAPLKQEIANESQILAVMMSHGIMNIIMVVWWISLSPQAHCESPVVWLLYSIHPKININKLIKHFLMAIQMSFQSSSITEA